MMGLGLGPFELILIFGVLLLLFGAKRLPELAGGMGKGIRDFKRALHSPDDEPNASVLQAQAPAPAALPETAAVP